MDHPQILQIGKPVTRDALMILLAKLELCLVEDDLSELKSGGQDVLIFVGRLQWTDGEFLKVTAELLSTCDQWAPPTLKKNVSKANSLLEHACRAAGSAYAAKFVKDGDNDGFRLQWTNFRRRRALSPKQGDKELDFVESSRDLIEWNIRIVNEAEEYLIATGSRSRDENYLKAIEDRLALSPGLIHYRILFGAPYHELLKDHLGRLVRMRPPGGRPGGCKTLYVGNYELAGQPEAFICGNEKMVLVVQPSFRGIGEYNTAILHGRVDVVAGYLAFVKSLHAAATPLESQDDIARLTLRSRDKHYA